MVIKQHPLYKTIPTGSEIIYAVEDAAVIANYKGKYIADIWIGSDGAALGVGMSIKVFLDSYLFPCFHFLLL